MLLWLGIAGCGFESVDDACRDGVRGERYGSDAAVDVVRRISCYRRFVGLDRGTIDEQVTEAVEAHARYLEKNAVLSTTGDWWAEAAALPGFTGIEAYDRLYTAEYLIDDPASVSVWEVLLEVPEDGARAAMIDQVMVDPFARDALLSPTWAAGGYAEFAAVGARFGYMNLVLYYPSGSHSNHPIAYPRDGQTDLPTTWVLNDADAAAAGIRPDVGLPISFTVGSTRLAEGNNPLQVQVLSSTIAGPGGEVPHAVLLPGVFYGGVNWSTAILLPTEALAPDTDYAVDVELSWIDHPGRREKLVFTTGLE